VILSWSIRDAQGPFPFLYQRHDKVSKKLSRLRKSLRDDTRQIARNKYFHTEPVLEIDRQIKQLLGKSDAEDYGADSTKDGDEDWQLPILEYVFPERARLVESFYGSEAESFDKDKLLARPYPSYQGHGCSLAALRTKSAGETSQSETLRNARNLKMKKPWVLARNPSNARLMCALSVVVYPTAGRLILLYVHKFPSKRKDSHVLLH
jgi:Protein of unknown function (DUF3435)